MIADDRTDVDAPSATEVYAALVPAASGSAAAHNLCVLAAASDESLDLFVGPRDGGVNLSPRIWSTTWIKIAGEEYAPTSLRYRLAL